MSPLYAALLVATTAFLIRYPFYRKSIGLIISITLTAIYGAILCLIMAPIGKRANINYYAGRFCAFIGTFLTGIRVEIEGAEHLEGERPRVVVANHQATLDILIMASIMPRNCVVIAKESLRYVPFLGIYSKLCNNLYKDSIN
jgi:lysophosphatidate acyltransferase